MMGDIVKLAQFRKLGPAPKSTTDALMPFQNRQRVKRRRRLGARAMRKARQELEDSAWALTHALRDISLIAGVDPDIRAIEAIMGEDCEYENYVVFETPQDIDRALAFVQALAAEYRKRFPPPKPKRVK